MIVRVRPFSLGCVRRRYMRRHGTRFNRHWHSLGFGESWWREGMSQPKSQNEEFKSDQTISEARAGKFFSVPLATMEPFPKNQSPNWNQDLKPGRQSRTPERTVAKRCKKKQNTRTGTLSEKCKTLCTYCTSKVFAEKLENKCMKS